MDGYHNTALVFDRLKDALLHFEYVVPMNITGEAMGFRPVGTAGGNSIDKFKEPSTDHREFTEFFGTSEAAQQLYPPHVARHPFFKDAVNAFDGFLFGYMVKSVEGDEVFRKYMANLAKVVGVKTTVEPDALAPSVDGLQRLFSKIVADFGLEGVPIDCSPFFLPKAEDASLLGSVSVHHLRVIDTDRLTIPQIMEFRADQDAMKKMRAFRIFAYEHYSDKGRAFIEDDLQRRLDDYTEAVRSSGFETKLKTLSFLFESKVLRGALATSAVAMLMGNPTLAIEAFSAGAIVEVGKLSLTYAQQRHELHKICRENPISYIADVRRMLNASE